jgi:Predicted sugar nucleotidyltransferases
VILRSCGIDTIVVVTGYKAEAIGAELASMAAAGTCRALVNPDFREGSVVSLWCARGELRQGDGVLVMDADVLYDQRLMDRLLRSAHVNCFLLDRDFEPGEEPVKVCVKDGRPVDFHKRIDAAFDYCGESVGFFRFSAPIARQLAEVSERYVTASRRAEWYEAAIRDLLVANPPGTFGFEDVTGLPWIEIDFREDVERAQSQILPRLLPLPEPAP